MVLAGNQFNADKEQGYFFVSPTVLSNVTLDMNIMQEETFGPVAPIITFKHLEEAVEIANSTPYGLAAYFFTNNYKTGTYLMRIWTLALSAGMTGHHPELTYHSAV